MLLAALGTGLLFGLAPALQALRLAPGIEAVGKRSLSPGGSKLRSVLVISQVALALVLALGAALLGRSLSLLLEVEPGFDRESLLTAEFSLPRARYPSAASQAEFFRALHESLKSTDGVLSAATVTAPPLRGPSGSRYFQIENAAPTAPGEGRNATFNLASPGYFETMGIPLLRGRDFTGNDDADGAPVAIVSEVMARRFWQDGDPLGERIRIGEDPWRTVVGVVGSVRQTALDEPAEPEMYWPQLQSPYPLATLVARTAREPLSVLPAIRSAVSSIDPDLPLGSIATGHELVSSTLASRRLPLALLSLFAATALGLTAVGLAGVLSYGVAVRTREIGLRLALGAEGGDIMRMVLGEGFRLLGWGAGLGVVASLLAGRFLSHLLYGVRAIDPQSYLAVGLLLTLVSLLAGYLPARRAMAVDAIAALRND
jgi:putative ABC transport system permease protein